MTLHEIRELCVSSAKLYFAFLSKKNKGLEIIDVLEIQKLDDNKKLYGFKLNKKLYNIDAIVLKNIFKNIEYTDKEIEIKKYDIKTNLLILKVLAENIEFAQIPLVHLKIISDLKFLVKNVEKWFTINEITGIPIQSSIIKNFNFEDQLFNMLIHPNVEQKEAIKLIFEKPFVYIWGPPGTGKTRCVLTYAIIPYILHNRKVCVFAPTNNALEQVLAALIENTDKLKIDRSKILRIGISSKIFAEKYPEICEVAGINAQLKELKNQVKLLHEVIALRDGKRKLRSISNMIEYVIEMDSLISEKEQMITIQIKRKKELNELEKNVNSIAYKFKSLFGKENTDKDKISFLKNEITADEPQISKTESRIELLLYKVKEIKTYDKVIDKLVDEINFINYLNKIKEIKVLKDSLEENIISKKAIENEYSNYSDDEINTMLSREKKSISELENQTIDEKIKNVNVIGLTLDAYISRYKDKGLFVDHYFIDEASYAPVIKVLTLFKNNVPITLFGDHKQLPPVCEMQEEDIKLTENNPIILWTKSSIYIESLFNYEEGHPIQKYILNNEHIFKNTSKCDLKQTHRFGNNLSQVLDDFIYKNGFKSANSNVSGNLELRYINAPLRKLGNKRENIDEAEHIKSFLQNYNLNDFAILAPYNDQVSLLGRLLQSERNQGKILTIHKSQGKEWETVIISVTDCKLIRPFFTDFEISNKFKTSGQVLNTALSRAKSRLILVCDYNFWINQNNQFITRVLEESTPMYNIHKFISNRIKNSS